MGNKRLKKKIESLNKQIKQHEDKIKREKISSSPDEGMLKHWEVEITAFRLSIEKTIRRFNK